jgi:hypothetical protein
MSEETQDLSSYSKDLKKQDVKKKSVSKKEDDLTESYKYVNKDNDELLTDMPLVPLDVKTESKNIESNIVKNSNLSINKPNNGVKSNKDLYESYIKELKNFSLSLNGEVLYDSTLDKTKEYQVKFENDFFVLYGKKYSYNGLKIQKINRK